MVRELSAKPRREEAGWTNILGVKVSAINLDLAEDIVATWIKTRAQNYICVTGVHGIMESQRDPELRKIHNRAGMVTPDGMPLVWLSRIGGHATVSRVYGPDLMLRLFEASVEKGWRHFLYGAAPATLDRLAARLLQKFPGAAVVGRYSPPFRPTTPEEDAAEVAMIEAARPDIVWVGLSTPKQERWMAAHRAVLSTPVLIGVGAAFDIHAGTLRQAPRALQNVGLEWAFRLAVEPRRLWRRYARNNPAFVAAVLMQAASLHRHSIDL
jgi:N-acetylglucosaminyldiphosphoundecaprenol N-acetyl-beta-D-mannosaminyltransferase